MAAIDDITALYVGYFNRAPDSAGLNFWIAQLNAGASLAGIADSFSKVPEATSLYGFLSAPLVGSAATFLSSVYLNLFGRVANATTDPAGFAYWTAQLNAPGAVTGRIIVDIISGATGDDRLVTTNKTTVGKAFTQKLVDTNTTFSASVASLAASALTGVTKDAATATAKIASNDTAITTASTTTGGTTFNLTTGVDSTLIAGTTGNDTYNGSTVYTAAEAVDATSTYTVVDTVAAGAGTDTLNLTISGAQDAAVVIPSASITGLEVLNVRNTVAQVASLDASTIAGLTALNSDRSSGIVTVTNLASGASAGVTGNGTLVNADFNAGYAAAATASTLNISGGTTAGAITLSGTGLTSGTVTSTGAANTIGALTLAATQTALTVNATTNLTTGALTNTTAAALTTLTVTGAGAVSFGATALQATVSKIDASANSGGLTVALGSLVTQTVTGGTGKDTITSNAVLTTGSVNGGDGSDTLILGGATIAATAALGAKYTNFETLRAAGFAQDVSLVSGIVSVQTAAGATLTGLNATQAAAVVAVADLGATSIALTTSSGTSDVLTITMGTGAAGSSAANSGVLTATGFETINLTALAGAGATAGTNRTSTFTGAIVDTSLTTLTLTGTAFSFTDISSTKALTINASALTGDGATTALGLTAAGNAKAGSVITGSSFRDVFTIGAEGSTYNGGAGNDSFTTTAAILTADGTTDLVLAGGAGTDTLTITGALTLTDNHLTNVTGMEALSTAETSAVSYTGFGAAAKTAFADGLTITSGTLADGATYTVGTGLYDKAVTLTLVSSGDGASNADNIAITTGSAADTISVTAASWTGATGGAAGQIIVSAGAGNDTISVSTGTVLAITTQAAVIITGGTGADAITSVGVNAASGLTPTYVIAAGDSLVSANDSITGFDMGTGALFSSTLDFASVALNAYTATAATGFTAAELTVAVSAAGLVTFAGTSAAGATLAQKIAAVQSVVITNAGDSALFTNGANSYVFNNNAAGDSLVELVGITGVSLVTTNATTAGAIFIA